MLFLSSRLTPPGAPAKSLTLSLQKRLPDNRILYPDGCQQLFDCAQRQVMHKTISCTQILLYDAHIFMNAEVQITNATDSNSVDFHSPFLHIISARFLIFSSSLFNSILLRSLPFIISFYLSFFNRNAVSSAFFVTLDKCSPVFAFPFRIKGKRLLTYGYCRMCKKLLCMICPQAAHFGSHAHIFSLTTSTMLSLSAGIQSVSSFWAEMPALFVEFIMNGECALMIGYLMQNDSYPSYCAYIVGKIVLPCREIGVVFNRFLCRDL